MYIVNLYLYLISFMWGSICFPIIFVPHWYKIGNITNLRSEDLHTCIFITCISLIMSYTYLFLCLWEYLYVITELFLVLCTLNFSNSYFPESFLCVLYCLCILIMVTMSRLTSSWRAIQCIHPIIYFKLIVVYAVDYQLIFKFYSKWLLFSWHHLF